MNLGSSPLARGLQHLDLDPGRDLGIIPARAGFTHWPSSWGPASPDHPRSRGVYLDSVPIRLSADGSSPLARGLQGALPGRFHHHGIIPARAGFTSSRATRILRSRDHPRSRGVYASGILSLTGAIGSSPLARGLRSVGVNIHSQIWIIPARAGFTSPAGSG